MKRIICTVTNDLNYDQRMIRVCTSLAGAGYEVWLTGRELPASKPLISRPYKQVRLRCLFNKGKLFYAEYNIRLFFFLAWHRADIINSIDLDTILPGFIISRLKGSIQVYDAHEYFTEVPEVINRPLVQKIWRRIERSTVPHVRYAYTVCESIAGLFREKYGTDFKTIMNAPLLKEQEGHQSGADREKFILYQGALNEGRGIENMIRAMHRIEGCSFRLIGEGDLSSSLREMVRQEGLEHKVKFLGFMLPDEMAVYTRRAYIGLNVSENLGLSYYYSLNNKFFDYIHAALPAITNKFPEYTRLNEQYGTCLMCDPDPVSLAEAVNRLLTDETLYRSLKDNCIKAKRELNWQAEEQKLIAFYQSMR